MHAAPPSPIMISGKDTCSEEMAQQPFDQIDWRHPLELHVIRRRQNTDVLHIPFISLAVGNLEHTRGQIQETQKGLLCLGAQHMTLLAVMHKPTGLDERRGDPSFLRPQVLFRLDEVGIDVRGARQQHPMHESGELAAQVVVEAGGTQDDEARQLCSWSMGAEPRRGRNDHARGVLGDLASGYVFGDGHG
jgi:hypothetical protein